jgi:hypothetical protein
VAPRRTLRLGLALAALAALPLHPHAVPAQPVPVRTLVPELRIGSVEGGDDSFSPGILAVVGPERSVFVLDPQQQRVAVFDARGRRVRAFGRRGEGPGELLSPSALGWVGDTLWVIDPMQLRTTLFRADGRVVRTVPWRVGSAASGPAVPTALLTGGSALTRIDGPAELVATGRMTRGPVLRTDREGRVRDTLAWHPLGHQVLRIAAGGRRLYTSQPWDDTPLLAAAPDGGAVVLVEREAARGERGNFTVTRLDARGDTLYSRRFAYAAVEVPRGFRERFARETARGLAAALRAAPGPLEEVVRREVFVPRYRPPVTAVVAGRDGTVWLRREEREGAAVVTWMVLDPRGRVEAEVRAPRELAVQQAERGAVWGVVRDELGIPYVVRYRVAPAR